MLRAIIVAHRWLGVTVCLLFAPWFVSGIVMMYGGDFPEIKADERIARAAAVDLSKVRLPVEEAWRKIGAPGIPDQARLATNDGRPVYRFRQSGKQWLVYADDGSGLTPEALARTAAAWSGMDTHGAKVEVLTAPDQWTVQSLYRPLRPLTKYSWPDGQEVYVSQVTGEVAQATTSRKRLAAYFGAITHWIDFTPLRKDAVLWTRVIDWTSGIGTAASVLGMVVGLWLYSPSKKKYLYAGKPSSVGFTGQKRWHTIFGLIFGLSTTGWVFSGLMSMDPIPSDGPPGGVYYRKIANELRGRLELSEFGRIELPKNFVAKEIEFGQLGRTEWAYYATGVRRTSWIQAEHGDGVSRVDTRQLGKIVEGVVAPMALAEVRDVTSYETYYGDRHGEHPLPVVMVRLADAQSSTFYIDPKTMRIVRSYDTFSRWNRWLYSFLHLLDLPLLYQHRPLWDVVMLFFLAGGTAVSVTSIVLGVHVLQRKFNIR